MKHNLNFLDHDDRFNRYASEATGPKAFRVIME